VGRLLATALVACAVALGTATTAAADPDDHVPYCSGDETPMDSNCRAPSSQVIVHDGTGLSPNLPYGLTPDSEPAI
jgi:hypothetical protein